MKFNVCIKIGLKKTLWSCKMSPRDIGKRGEHEPGGKVTYTYMDTLV